MDILQEILKELEKVTKEEDPRIKVEVAKFDESLKRYILEYKKKQRLIHDHFELKKAELEIKFKREADEVLDPIVERLEDEKKEFWDFLYSRLGLDPEADYTISMKDQKIYQKVEPIKSENRWMN